MEYLPYKFTGKEMDEETGLYYYGARYLDPKYSMWISTDPALGEYIPIAPTNDKAKKHNSNLPGMGGVFNHINFNLYHYAGDSPVKYTDPDGRLMRDAEGNLVFDPDKDKNGNAVIEKNGGGTVKQDGGKTIRFDRIPGYLYTDRGSKVRAYKNLTDDKDLQTNCIGTTFADGEYWIEPDSAGNNNVELILKDDGYTEISRGNCNLNQLKSGDTVIFRNCSNKIHHAAIFLNVNKGTINVLSKNGGRPKGEMSLYKIGIAGFCVMEFF